jgi:exonuclease III
MLLEFKPSNRLYTWANNQSNLIQAALDRFFASVDWEQHFPLSSVQALSRAVSDHPPLVIDTGHVSQFPPKLFRFEKWWISQPGFTDLVMSVWSAPCPCTTALDIWQYKLRLLRKKMKGWNINVEAANKKLKTDLLLEFDILYVFSEQNRLSINEKDRLHAVKMQLNSIW